MIKRTMYVPQKDSPTTFTLGDITGADTFVTVATSSLLPQTFPFPLTLGIDKSITETVMVTAIDANSNQLTITRDPSQNRAWLAGTVCARVFTADDLKTVQDNLSDVIDQSDANLARLDGDLDPLASVVGDVNSGLVKDLNDEISRATSAESGETARAQAAESAIDSSKINRVELPQALTDAAFSADGVDVTLTLTKYNADTQATGNITRHILAGDDVNSGVMTPEVYNEVTALRNDVGALQQQGGRFIGQSFTTKANLDAYSIPATVKTGDFTYVLDDETQSGATTRYIYDGAIFGFGYIIEHDVTVHTGDVTGGVALTIANGSVTNSKLGNLSVGEGKIINDAVTTSKIANDAVTTSKMANITRGSIIVGGTSNAPTYLAAKTLGGILMGDGTDLKLTTTPVFRDNVSFGSKVAIGKTSAPAYGLDVYANVDSSFAATIYNASTNGQGLLLKTGTVGTQNILRLKNGNNSDVLTVDANGTMIGLDIRSSVLSTTNGGILRFWSTSDYSMQMLNALESHYGPVQSWAIKSSMPNNAQQGWSWGVYNQTPVAALEATTGNFQTAGYVNSDSIITNKIVLPSGSQIRLNGDDNTYAIQFGEASSLYRYGPVTSTSIKTMVHNNLGKGFTWGTLANSPVAALEATTGNFQTAGYVDARGGLMSRGVAGGVYVPLSAYPTYAPFANLTAQGFYLCDLNDWTFAAGEKPADISKVKAWHFRIFCRWAAPNSPSIWGGVTYKNTDTQFVCGLARNIGGDTAGDGVFCGENEGIVSTHGDGKFYLVIHGWDLAYAIGFNILGYYI